jgi:hydrogenase/urease accessory protein HupE
MSSLPGSSHGFTDGFLHPLTGWDHLLAMFAVGLWAAQHRGRALWLIPLSFVGVMVLGGILGVAGVYPCRGPNWPSRCRSWRSVDWLRRELASRQA